MDQARIINPNLSIVPMRDGDAISAFDVKAVVKGRGRLHSVVKPEGAFSSVFDVLQRLLQKEPGLALSAAAMARLTHIGVLVAATEVARPVRFACRLEQIEEGNLPVRLRPPLPSAPLQVSPSLTMTTIDELALEHPEIRGVWEDSRHLVIVRDARSGIEYPYWLNEESHELIERLEPGRPAPSDLDATHLRRLFLAGILEECGGEPFEPFVEAARAQFAARGYVVLRRLLRATHIAAMREYYERVLEEGFVHYRDRQVPLRYAEHSEPLMVYYHAQLRMLFEAIVGRTIKCSYPYFAAYRTGASLEKHTDREQCEVTASLLVDQRPQPEDCSDWPLYLEVPTGEQVAIHMGLGDIALYRGRELPHYRLPFAGELMTCHFYHYVNADFEGPLS